MHCLRLDSRQLPFGCESQKVRLRKGIEQDWRMSLSLFQTMSLFVCINVYVYVSVCVHVCVYICICVCVHIWRERERERERSGFMDSAVYTCQRIPACIYVHLCVCMCTYFQKIFSVASIFNFNRRIVFTTHDHPSILVCGAFGLKCACFHKVQSIWCEGIREWPSSLPFSAISLEPLQIVHVCCLVLTNW